MQLAGSRLGRIKKSKQQAEPFPKMHWPKIRRAHLLTSGSDVGGGGVEDRSMAGQSIKTAITNMATRNRREMPAMRPAKEASRCLASYCSSSSISGQKENQCRHNEHEHDEDARDCHVIGLSSVVIRVSWKLNAPSTCLAPAKRKPRNAGAPASPDRADLHSEAVRLELARYRSDSSRAGSDWLAHAADAFGRRIMLRGREKQEALLPCVSPGLLAMS